MSVRAYIIRTKKIWINEDKGFFQYNNDGENLTRYIHEDEEYAINVWHQEDLIEKMCDYGAEKFVNQDLLGQIEMGKDDFLSMYEMEDFEGDDLESVEVIKEYFNQGNLWLVLKCY